MNLSDIRALFPALERHVYLDSAAVGILSAASVKAADDVMVAMAADGIVAAPGYREALAGQRTVAAELIGGSADRIAFTQNTTTALAIAVNGIDWREGDNVVLPQEEFPSNRYPWMHLARRGVEVRMVPMNGGFAPPDAIAERVDGRTRAVALSSVQFSSGYRYDLDRVADARGDALLVVDATQSVGALTLDADELGIDLLAVSSHKWMLGPFGSGFAHLSPRAMTDLVPSTPGWLAVEAPFAFDPDLHFAADARRFESGTENIAGIAAMTAAIELVLRIGRVEVEKTVRERATELVERLGAVGMRPVYDIDEGHRSGIVIVEVPDPAAAHARLLDAGVRCSLRSGGIRFAPHFFTSEDDLERAVAVLSAQTH